MAKRILKLTFPAELIRQPIIYNLAQQFSVVTNILRANVEMDSGWVVLELQGDDQEMEQAIFWLVARSVTVEPANTSILV